MVGGGGGHLASNLHLRGLHRSRHISTISRACLLFDCAGPLLGSVEDVRRYHQAYIKFASLLKRTDVREAWLHEFVLQPGEVITFNQRRMLHGRRGFEWRDGVQPASPEDRAPRHLKGTYLNIDDFLSTYRVLRYKAGLSPRGLDDADHVGCRSS